MKILFLSTTVIVFGGGSICYKFTATRLYRYVHTVGMFWLQVVNTKYDNYDKQCCGAGAGTFWSEPV